MFLKIQDGKKGDGKGKKPGSAGKKKEEVKDKDKSKGMWLCPFICCRESAGHWGQFFLWYIKLVKPSHVHPVLLFSLIVLSLGYLSNCVLGSLTFEKNIQFD